MSTRLSDVGIETVAVDAYVIPTDEPESDGTLEWTSTTLVLVEVHGSGEVGIGYSYTDAAATALVRDALGPVVVGRSALDVPAAREAMLRAVRNVGRPGLASSAIAAVETALWDLKARLLDVSLASLLGRRRDEVALYGSGGFTSSDEPRLREQLGHWVEQGMRSVKIKIGRAPARDVERVRAARHAIGPAVESRAMPLSAHTAPLLHLHLGCAAPRLAHIEYFHDHVRIERLAFDGMPDPCAGKLRPDVSRPGLGVDVKRADLEPYRRA